MQRYFIEQFNTSLNQAVISGTDVHHMKHVMRFKVGDDVIVCNYNGECYYSQIQELTEEQVVCTLNKPVQSNDLGVQVDIAQALIRREKFEYMIQKSTELGVHTIIPITTKYCVVKLDDKNAHKKNARWNTLAKEASEQSHRNHLSTVGDVCAIMDLPFADYDIVLLAYEQETNSPKLKTLLQKKYDKILVIIGPEGGFDNDEIQRLKPIDNLYVVGLGARILRSETASSYILSVLSYVYEMSENE